MQEVESGSKATKEKLEIQPAVPDGDLAQHLNAFEVSIKEFLNEKFEAISRFKTIDNSKDKLNSSSTLDEIPREAIIDA